MNLNCVFYTASWTPNNRLKYTCGVQDQHIDNKKIKHLISDEISSAHNNLNVKAMWFKFCTINEIPENIFEHYPNLEILEFYHCKIKELTRNQLKGVVKLKELTIFKCNITHLQGDLFLDLKNLEAVELFKNEITFVDPNTFKSLNKLKLVDLTENPGINVCYAQEPFEFPSDKTHLKIHSLKELNDYLDILQPNSCIQDIRQIMTNEDFKDLTIKMGEEETKVHKFVLAARSKVFANLILNNPDASVLNLAEISMHIFKQVLNYIYTDQLPPDTTNSKEIFAAASFLEIKGLQAYASKMLVNKISSDNSLQILFLANKYGDEELKCKAFEEIKKLLPDKNLRDDLKNKPEELKTLIAAKKRMDEQIKRMQEDFDKLANNFK